MQRWECRTVSFSFYVPSSAFCVKKIPELPGRRERAAPAPSQRLHREALARAADPVTASRASICSNPRREGLRRIPANPAQSAESANSSLFSVVFIFNIQDSIFMLQRAVLHTANQRLSAGRPGKIVVRRHFGKFPVPCRQSARNHPSGPRIKRDGWLRGDRKQFALGGDL
jgi:hypothetical protein